MSHRWALIKNTRAAPDAYTGRVYAYRGQYGKPVPVLLGRALMPEGEPVQIPDALAWKLAEVLLAAGGTLPEPEATAVGMHLKASC